MSQIYYTPPSSEAFEDMKAACIALWETKGNEGGYRDEKISHIANIANVGDNFMFMFAMLDINNQRIVARNLKQITIYELVLRLRDGGNPEYLIDQILGK